MSLDVNPDSLRQAAAATALPQGNRHHTIGEALEANAGSVDSAERRV